MEADRRAWFDYSTPVYATEQLIAKEGFTGSIWEPACGRGAISKVFRERGHEVYSTDLFEYGYGTADVNFLISSCLFGDYHYVHDNIVTNPPPNQALDFIRVAKKYARFKIALLLKTTFLETVERRAMFSDKEFAFKKMYQFVRRLTFHEGDAEKVKDKNGGMLSLAWFVWERGYEGNAQIDWID